MSKTENFPNYSQPAAVLRDTMWLACHTQEEISEAVGVSDDAIGVITRKKENFPNFGKPAAVLRDTMWLACHTDTEISEATGLSHAAMTKITSDFTLGKLSKSEITSAEAVGVSQGEIAKSIPNGNLSERNKSDQPAAVGVDPTDHALRVSGKTENFPKNTQPAAVGVTKETVSTILPDLENFPISPKTTSPPPITPLYYRLHTVGNG